MADQPHRENWPVPSREVFLPQRVEPVLMPGNMTRSQLDKLGERLKRGNPSKADLIALARFRNAFIASTNAVAQKIASRLGFVMANITQRPAKSTLSIIAKLRREHCRLVQVQDIGGVRIVVSKVSVQDRVVDLVKVLYPAARVTDRRGTPQHGYRAVHVVVQENSHPIEVQIRTRMQDGWSQLSEKLADLHDPRIKYGRGPEPILGQLTYLTNYCANVEAREVALDAYKRAEINALNRKKRNRKMSKGDNARLASYRRLLQQRRDAKTAMLRYLKQVTS